MCSTRQERIAALGQAIEDFASQTQSEAVTTTGQTAGEPADRTADTAAVAPGPVAADRAEPSERALNDADMAMDNPAGTPGAEAPIDALSRLAELWAELAALDPEIAKRLPIYEA